MGRLKSAPLLPQERLMNKRLALAASFALAAALFLGGARMHAQRWYGTGSGSDLAPLGCTPHGAPGRYRSLYRTVAWAHARQGAQTQAAQRQGAPAVPSVEDRGDIRRQTFEIVWRTVKEKHFDPAMGGVDWDKAHETYAPRVAAVKSDRELYPLLQEMLGLLRQSHFNIIPPESNAPEDRNEPSSGGVGIDLRLVGGAAMITRVEPDSSASRAGLRPGFLIKQVDDRPVEEIIAAFAKSAERTEIKNIRMTRSVLAAVNGDPGAPVKIIYLDDKDRTRETILMRERLKGELSPRFGNLPPQATQVAPNG